MSYWSTSRLSTVLKAAAVYNLIWGTWVILFPLHFFELTGMELPTHEVIWQGMGMVIGAYGLGYFWASFDPIRHWPIVAVGLIGKLAGPAGFVMNYFMGKVPAEFGYMLITNDLIWWAPFFAIILKARTAGWPLQGA